MSNYRDDTTDIAIGVDKSWAGLTAMADDAARLADAFVLTLLVLFSDAAYANDSIDTRAAAVAKESATAHDGLLTKKIASAAFDNHAMVADRLFYQESRLLQDAAVTHEKWQSQVIKTSFVDNATAKETLMGIQRARVIIHETLTAIDRAGMFARFLSSDMAVAHDVLPAKNYAQGIVGDHALINGQWLVATRVEAAELARVADTLDTVRFASMRSQAAARASDEFLFAQQALLQDIAIATSDNFNKAKIGQTINESAAVYDTLFFNRRTNLQPLADSAIADDDANYHLTAKACWQDMAVMEGAAVCLNNLGFDAWTANTDTWAMSRYADLPIKRFVVIDGVLYGEADDGIYQMNVADSRVSASVVTGKMDFGEVLAHPTGAYLEYELNGSATMQVKTTQSGQQQAYNYALPAEQASELTNGRIVFGRGLRGRHFAFVLNFSATHGYINSLSINALPTKRRI